MEPNPTGGRLRSEVGATAVEIFVGLMLTLVMVMAAQPLFGELMASYQLRGATHEVFAELQRTRLAAVMQNNPQRFTVIAGSPNYKIHDDLNGDYYEDTGEVTIRKVGVDQVALTGTTVLTFLANGTVLTPGQISIANGRGATRRVEIGAGGSIRIQ